MIRNGCYFPRKEISNFKLQTSISSNSKGNVDVDDNPEDDAVIYEDELDSFGRQFNLRKAHKTHEITGGLDDVTASELKETALLRSAKIIA